VTLPLDLTGALDEYGLRGALRKAVVAAGGQAAWARKHHVSPSQVCEAMGGCEPMGPNNAVRRALLSELGLRPVQIYVPIRKTAKEDAA
jgi:hypothetical protein